MSTKHPEEFKQEAVRRALTSDQPIAKTARELGINENTLHDWVAKYRSTVLDSHSNQLSLEQQLKELRKENARLKEECDILKKFATYCARDIK